MSSRISFTIRPPPASRSPSQSANSSRAPSSLRDSFVPHAPDSSDEEDNIDRQELVTGFDQSGVQRLKAQPKPAGPLVIPALANRDWRANSRVRGKQTYIPDGAAAPTGKDGSQGGLGTRDSINSGPQKSGLVFSKKETVMKGENAYTLVESKEISVETIEQVEEDDDERARKALLASLANEGNDEDAITIDAIPLPENNHNLPLDETEAYKRDVVTRPDSATLADYERVPVSQFGAALLRGMGWKEGTAASRTRRGLVEPWVPASRPALLGLGAKERPAEDIPAPAAGGFVNKRPEKRYVPVVKLQREGSELPPSSRSRSGSPSRSRNPSRVPSSKSASPYPDQDRDRHRRHRDSDRTRGEGGYDRSGRDIDYNRKDRDSKRYSDWDNDRDQNERDRDKDRGRGSERDYRSRKGKDYRRDENDRKSRH